MNFKESLDKPIFKTICKIADQLNFPTYVVGGWVRDLLLKRKRKIEDIDFVCIGSGIILAEKITQELGADANLKVFKNLISCAYRCPWDDAILYRDDLPRSSHLQ